MSDASRQARRTKRAAGEVASVQRNELGTGEDWSEARASASERGLDASEASTKCEYIACVETACSDARRSVFIYP